MLPSPHLTTKGRELIIPGILNGTCLVSGGLKPNMTLKLATSHLEEILEKVNVQLRKRNCMSKSSPQMRPNFHVYYYQNLH